MPTNKKALTIKLRQSLPHNKNSFKCGNCRGFNTDSLEEKKKPDIYKHSISDHSTTNSSAGKKMHSATSSTEYAHHTDNLTPCNEKSLSSLLNGFSRTQPGHSDLTRGNFCLGVLLHSFRLKRIKNKQTQTSQKPNTKGKNHGIDLALCNYIAEKLSLHCQTNLKSTLWSSKWF